MKKSSDDSSIKKEEKKEKVTRSQDSLQDSNVQEDEKDSEEWDRWFPEEEEKSVTEESLIEEEEDLSLEDSWTHLEEESEEMEDLKPLASHREKAPSNPEIKNSSKKKNKKNSHHSKRKKVFPWLGVGFITCIILFILFYFLMVPSLTLKGKTYVKVEYGSSYVEEGYVAKYLGRDLTDKVSIEGNINPEKLGVYELKYRVRKNRITVTKTRKIEIIDSVSPVITLNGEEKVTICPLGEYEEEGYVASDNYDGELTSQVKVTNKEDEIEYEVSDTSGHSTKVVRTLERVDNEKPVITLKGSVNYYVTVGKSYVEPGYTATDNCEEDLTANVKVSGNVDTSKKGEYLLTYTVSDSSGNEASVTRKVIVSMEVVTKDPVKGTIYLTFDDGPSGTITPKLLDILKEKNVKATFFVINHSSNLDYLIKREYDEGHTVALHSMTHNYATVYQSVDSYFNDLQQISDKVERITGKKTMLIRFPGGSSNTVSRNYSSGIMTTLTNEVLNRGYHYFDWNVSSGDVGEAKTKEQVYNNVVKNLSKSRANVVLMHDFESNYKTLNAISDIIDYGKANGYEFLTIDMSTAMVRHKVNN